MKKILLFTLLFLSLLPHLAWGQSIVVTPISYRSVWTDEALPEPAKIVEGKVIEALLEQGWQVTPPEHTKEAFESFAAGDLEDCSNIVCLKRLASELEATEAVYISIKDNDGADFNVEVVFANSEPIIAKKSSSFDAFNRWLCDNIQLRLGEYVGLFNFSKDGTTAVDGDDPLEKKGLKPTAFIISATATCSFAVAWAITEIIGLNLHSTLDDLEENDGVNYAHTETEYAFRTANWTLLGLTGAGLITSTVLFFLTDFKQTGSTDDPPKSSKSRTLITPTITQGGGLVTLHGTF